VHVVSHTAAQNISDAQIRSQIDVLNRDYRKRNGDITKIPGVFAPLAADTLIEFALADKDPSGNPTTGITRKNTTATSFSDDDKVKHASSGGADAWPSDKYLNIWVCPLGGGLLGYAQFPGGPAATDGVVILHSAFGTTGTATAPFNLGRSATHEVGHWLNLRHIWGDDGGGCNGDDFITDTPNQADHNFGKPAFPHVTCSNGPNGDMFMNYMDYTDDDSMFMFTAGQMQRMQACLDGDRPHIGTQAVTNPAIDVGTVKFRDDNPPTLKFNEDVPPPTIKFQDDAPPTLKFRDDVPPPTIKFQDDAPPTLKFRDDFPPPTIKFRDDSPPTLKFRDDFPPPTIKFRDDSPPTVKFRDDVKTPFLDKPPNSDVATGFGNDQPPIGPGPDPGPLFNPGFGGGGFGGGGGRGGVPFVLSTPHHSMAWRQSFPQSAQAEMQALAQQIAEVESILTQYVQAEDAGQLGDEDRAQGDALSQEYDALMMEYQRLAGM
jgi:hypothetical protein